MMYAISRFLFLAYLRACFDFEIKGRENIPEKGPYIIVANHISYADPIVIGATFKRVKVIFVAKEELFRLPVFGLWFKSLGCIPIERWSGSSRPLKSSLKKLKQGGTLGIFPEGTRSIDGNLQKAQPGIGFIALKSRVPVIPMYILGSDRALPRGAKMPRPCRVTSRVGTPVDISEAYKIEDKRKAYEFVGDKIMESIARLRDEG